MLSRKTSSHHLPADRRGPAFAPSHLKGTSVALGAVGVVALLLLMQAPAAVALPAVSALLLLAGFALAGITYLVGARPGSKGLGGYEIAGALVFLGFAGALLADGDQTLAFFEQAGRHGLAGLTK
jgi:hypothetical protein